MSIQSELKSRSDLDYETNIIAVSKTFSIDVIKPLIEHGHLHYGENKVQEAVIKWTEIKKTKEDLKLHMIGKLQSNKVKYVVPLFDYIHSLDNLKLAEKISSEQKKVNRRLKIFIQVNIGDEDQKNGIHKNQVSQFFKKCINDFNLDIIGLMCIPPVNKDPSIYFQEMSILNNSLGFSELSMGMSSDYLKAFQNSATFLRIGSNIFGNRY